MCQLIACTLSSPATALTPLDPARSFLPILFLCLSSHRCRLSYNCHGKYRLGVRLCSFAGGTIHSASSAPARPPSQQECRCQGWLTDFEVPFYPATRNNPDPTSGSISTLSTAASGATSTSPSVTSRARRAWQLRRMRTPTSVSASKTTLIQVSLRISYLSRKCWIWRGRGGRGGGE